MKYERDSYLHFFVLIPNKCDLICIFFKILGRAKMQLTPEMLFSSSLGRLWRWSLICCVCLCLQKWEDISVNKQCPLFSCARQRERERNWITETLTALLHTKELLYCSKTWKQQHLRNTCCTSGFWQFVQKVLGSWNQFLQQLSMCPVTDDLDAKGAGCGGAWLITHGQQFLIGCAAKFTETPLESISAFAISKTVCASAPRYLKGMSVAAWIG